MKKCVKTRSTKVLTAERSPEQPNGLADAELSRWMMQGQHCQAMHSTPDLGGGNWKDSAGDGRQPESRKSKMVGGGYSGVCFTLALSFATALPFPGSAPAYKRGRLALGRV